MLKSFSTFSPPDALLVPLLNRRKVFSLPKPCPELEKAWAAIPGETNPASTALTTELLDLQFLSLGYAEAARAKAGLSSPPPSPKEREYDVTEIAGMIYLKGIHSTETMPGVARVVKEVIKDPSIPTDGLDLALRTVTMANFREFWATRSAFSELLNGYTYRDAEQKIPVPVIRQSHQSDEVKEAMSVAAFVGALFSEGLVTFEDIRLCLGMLLPTTDVQRTFAAQLVIFFSGDKICKTKNAQYMADVRAEFADKCESVVLPGDSFWGWCLETSITLIDYYSNIQKEKRDRCVKGPGEGRRYKKKPPTASVDGGVGKVSTVDA